MNRLFSLLIVCFLFSFALSSCGEDAVSQTAENKVEEAKTVATTPTSNEVIKATPVAEKEVKDDGPLELSVPEVEPKERAVKKEAVKEKVESLKKHLLQKNLNLSLPVEKQQRLILNTQITPLV